MRATVLRREVLKQELRMEAQDLTAELVAVEDEGAPDAQPNCSSDESLLASMKQTDGPKIPKCKYIL